MPCKAVPGRPCANMQGDLGLKLLACYINKTLLSHIRVFTDICKHSYLISCFCCHWHQQAFLILSQFRLLLISSNISYIISGSRSYLHLQTTLIPGSYYQWHLQISLISGSCINSLISSQVRVITDVHNHLLSELRFVISLTSANLSYLISGSYYH